MPNAVIFALKYIIPVAQNVMFVLLLARGVTIYKQRKGIENIGQVSLSPLLLWVGSVCGGVFCVLITVYGLTSSPSIILWIGFEAFAVLDFVLMLAYCNETIVYDGDSFTAKNLVGLKRTCSYVNISGICRKGYSTVLRCKQCRRIRLDCMANNSRQFIKYADACYYRQFQKHIPEITKRDPMRGNLGTPWLYLVIYILAIVIGILLTLQSVYCLRPAENNLPSDAFKIRTSFVSCERIQKNSGTLVLNADGFKKPFSLSWLSGFEVPVPDSDSLCSGTEFVVSVKEGKKEYRIYEISTADQRMLLSAYECNNAYRNSQIGAGIILLVFVAFLITWAVFGILIGRNPERFPKRVRNLFYKPWAWTPTSMQKDRRHKKKHQ